MSFAAREQERLSRIRDELFCDRGGEFFKGTSYAHILLDPTKNLWAAIREDALDYFSRNSIVWWGGGGSTAPTGNLLSSQVACVNHLYALRLRVDLATAVLKGNCSPCRLGKLLTAWQRDIVEREMECLKCAYSASASGLDD
jgi:hypothetical protein